MKFRVAGGIPGRHKNHCRLTISVVHQLRDLRQRVADVRLAPQVESLVEGDSRHRNVGVNGQLTDEQPVKRPQVTDARNTADGNLIRFRQQIRQSQTRHHMPRQSGKTSEFLVILNRYQKIADEREFRLVNLRRFRQKLRAGPFEFIQAVEIERVDIAVENLQFLR